VAADLYQHVGRNEDDYRITNQRPISVAHDDFSVMGSGVSGIMRPYRLEVGALAFPKKMSSIHEKYNLISFLDDYKVGFRYENSASNGYDYHSYIAASSADSPDGINHDKDGIGTDYPGRGVLIVKDPRLMGLDGPAIRTAPARKGIYNGPVADPAKRERRFVQGKHVEWFSNEEILQMYRDSPNGNGNGFLEFQKPIPEDTYPTTREWVCDDNSTSDWQRCRWQDVPGSTLVRVNNPFRVTLPGKGIGAFAVTAEDGTTYHYSLPVYHYTQFGRSDETVGEVSRRGVSTQTIGEVGSGYGYATTWLLTAITSADYIDRGSQGVIDDSDWGGWVKFDYGKFSSKYKWRQPYIGSSYSVEDPSTNSFSEGYKETYYLNSIRTRTHTALFVKSVRQDARGHFRPTGLSNLRINETAPSSSLRLDEIVVLTNEDLAKLQTADGIRESNTTGGVIPAFSANTANNANTFNSSELSNGDSYAQVFDKHDLEVDARIRAFVNQRALKRVVLNYSYRLCPGTPNSFASLAQLPDMSEAGMSVGRSGKLTLESVSTYGPLSTKLAPDYIFRYGPNPAYGKEKWDGFGMYKRDGQRSANGHQVSSDFIATQDATAWSLVELVTPLGGRTEITYERDQYSHISEHSAGSFNKHGGDLRVAAVTTSDESNNRYQVRYRYNTSLNTQAAPRSQTL